MEDCPHRVLSVRSKHRKSEESLRIVEEHGGKREERDMGDSDAIKSKELMG